MTSYLLTEKATVLLIGSTGNGKSALGNFLLDPTIKKNRQERQYFSTSTDLQPHTNETEVMWETVTFDNSFHSRNLTVIDTPGFNDVKDFKNMIFLMKKLQDLQEINTCIVVVKCDGKIDNQYKETLLYYKNLLPDLFKKNLIVVVTHYLQDKASIERREITEEVIRRDILGAVRETCELSDDPPLFLIDSKPLEGDDISPVVRNNILRHVFNQEPTIPQFKVTKPPSLVQHDRTVFDKLVQDATEQSHQTYKNNPELQNELNVINDDIAELKANKKHWEAKRDDLDTEELVDHVHWNTKKKRKLMEKRSDRYHLSTCPYKIRNVIKGGGGEHWREEQKTECTLSGKVESSKNHGFRAHITLQIHKRDKFEKEIIDCKEKIKEIESQLTAKLVKQTERKQAHEMIFKEKSERLIEDARQKNKHYLNPDMTPEEAIKRLNEM